MYLTTEQRLEIARVSWEQAQKSFVTLNNKFEKLSRMILVASGTDYCLLDSEIELIKVQREAVRALVEARWASYQSASEALQAA